MANNMKNISNRISNVLDIIIKEAGNVMKFENEAIEASKLMEEASFKSQIARNNMISVNYFLNYKTVK